MTTAAPTVSVFHPTSRISNARIRKYKLATERGMAPASGKGAAMPPPANGHTASATQLNGGQSSTSPDSSVIDATDSPSLEPPAKKRSLKLNVRQKGLPNVPPMETIANSKPKRNSVRTARASLEEAPDVVEPPKKKQKRKSSPQPSPAPSSGLSSLSSAPPSERAESPFKDPSPPATREDYGDFMSYYVMGGDDEADDDDKAKPDKSKTSQKAKGKSKVEEPKEPKQTRKQKQQKLPTPATQSPAPSSAKPVQQQAPPPAQAQQPTPQQQPQLPQQQQPPPQQFSPPPRTNQAGPPTYPNVPHIPQFGGPPPLPGNRGPPPPPHFQRPPPGHPHGPPPLPQPIVQFIDVVNDPKPTSPDTVATMIRKLESLSSALTNFGGVPAAPGTPPVVKAAKPPPVESNPLDNFLSHFGGEDDDSDTDEPTFEYILPDPGTPDGPLTYGIQFIQNALKSWAQQRMTQQVLQQWNTTQAQQFQQQMAAQRRGPGRPRRYDDPDQPIQPIIQMNLVDTPEGVAIKAFQCVLDSGVLQVNATLPQELARALRHLYMQIDHLINQGSRNDGEWQCMSYAAQIASHKMRVEKWKEQHAQAHDEVVRQQQLADQQVLAAMNGRPMTAEEAQRVRQHDMQLERRRSEQHADRQPYNKDSHLRPLQMSQPPPGSGFGMSPSPASASHTIPFPGPASGTPPIPSNGGAPPAEVFNGAPIPVSTSEAGGLGQVQLDKMKMYMPGLQLNLPLSGQSMNFSFPPNSENAVKAFGASAFPLNQQASSSVPNRGPMSASAPPPSGPGAAANGCASAPPPSQAPGNADSPIEIHSDANNEQTMSEAARNGEQQQQVQAPKASGFTAINAPSSSSGRPSSLPAGSPRLLSAASPAVGSSKSNDARMKGFPHPGAIVVDE